MAGKRQKHNKYCSCDTKSPFIPGLPLCPYKNETFVFLISSWFVTLEEKSIKIKCYYL